MPDVTMPRLSESMAEGTILRWLKSDGDPVRPGEELVEIETDKATETYAAAEEGVLEVIAAVGETLPVGAVIARLDGVAADAPAIPAPAARPAPAVGARGETTVVEASRAQGVVARRMAESRATIPSFTMTAEVDVSAALEARAQLSALDEPTPALEDFVVKACALALREHPRVNASYRDGRFEQHGRVNVGIAVSGDASLVVPTVFDADVKPLAVIARDARALADKARAGAITSPDLAGGTFTVASLGRPGVTRFEAIISPGQAAALAVGSPAERPVVRAGAVVVRTVLELTLSCDHRILFAGDAASFLSRVRALLESPAALLV